MGPSPSKDAAASVSEHADVLTAAQETELQKIFNPGKRSFGQINVHGATFNSIESVASTLRQKSEAERRELLSTLGQLLHIEL